MRLSIVIPTRNKAPRLRLALTSYLQQSCGLDDLEILVIADGCGGDTASVVGEFEDRLPIRLLETPWQGQAASRNLGAEEARGEVLGFFDDDILLCPEYLERALAAVADSAAVARGPVHTLTMVRIFRDPATGEPYPELTGSLRPDSPLLRYRVSEKAVRTDWPRIEAMCRGLNRFEALVERCLTAPADSGEYLPWVAFSGSGVLIERATFLRNGGYDPAFGRDWGAESLELGYRLWRAGIGFRHLPEILSAHLDHPRLESLATFDKTFQYFFDKHRDEKILWLQRQIWSERELGSALAPATMARER